MTQLLSLPVRVAPKTVALVGNPNTGKSTVFNALTGFRQRVGNYPGVTVDKRTGVMKSAGEGPAIELIDLPGAYSLGARGEDEALLMDVLLGKQRGTKAPDLIVCVVDASRLSRNLFFTTQLLELGKPVVVALTMTDLSQRAGHEIDARILAEELGVPVVPVVATRGKGISALRQAIQDTLEAPLCGRCASFPDCVCAELDGLCESLTGHSSTSEGNAVRAEALQTLLDPGGFHEKRLTQRCGLGMADELAERRRRILQAGVSLVEVEAKVRYAWIDRVLKRVVQTPTPRRRSKTELADRVLTHRLLGSLVLIVLMGICFQSVYAWATPLMDGIDVAVGSLGEAVGGLMSAGPLRSLIIDGGIAGVGGVLVFLPQILILFLFIAVLEDCGYMAGAAFLLDRWMSLVGLGGRSFIPLLSSFACAVPGIMAARTIEDRRDRFVTILIAPLMSCSARLPVYVLLIGAFVPSTPILGGVANVQALTLLAMYLVGAVVAIPVAWLLKRTLFKGKAQSFLMELPSYKWPSPRTVFFRLYEQGRAFVVTAGTMIFAVSVIVWALAYYPHSQAITSEFASKRVAATELAGSEIALADTLAEIDRAESGAHLRNSFLGRMGRFVEPAVQPLGWDWRIGTGVLASFLAREVVVATMGTIYNLGGDVDVGSTGLRDKLREASWPDGRPVFNVAVALSVMVFFALCCQCASTLATIKRETKSWLWPGVAFAYMTTLAYAAAFVIYQAAIRLV